MIRLVNGLDRTWSFDRPVGVFPALLERLRGGPVRAEELVAGVPDTILRARPGRQLVGERAPRTSGRPARPRLDTLGGARRARRSPLGRRHDKPRDRHSRPRRDSVSEILRRFRDHRSALVLRREALTEDDLDSKSRHPRLRRAIRLIDWMQCVAGHDDHHFGASGKLRLHASARLHRRLSRGCPPV